jgi:hypothetical protein
LIRLATNQRLAPISRQSVDYRGLSPKKKDGGQSMVGAPAASYLKAAFIRTMAATYRYA